MESEHHEKVLALSRIVDQVAEEYLGDDRDWDPLHNGPPHGVVRRACPDPGGRGRRKGLRRHRGDRMDPRDQIRRGVVAERHRKLREAGWTVINTGTPGSADLLRELEEASEIDTLPEP